jgi:hypothetical protein
MTTRVKKRRAHRRESDTDRRALYRALAAAVTKGKVPVEDLKKVFATPEEPGPVQTKSASGEPLH